MKKIYKVIAIKFLFILFVFNCFHPGSLSAQISSVQNNNSPEEIESVRRNSPNIIFRIAPDHGHLSNPLYVDLPAGASLQYNGEGVYQINNMPDEYGQYNMKLRSGGDILNGVTTADISLIQRHILGKGHLTSEHGLIAADVNCDGRISAKDMVDIRRAILGSIDMFGCDTNFTFYPNALDFHGQDHP